MLLVVVASVACWYSSEPYKQSETPGVEVLAVDPVKGVAVLRHVVTSMSEDGEWSESVHYEVRRVDGAKGTDEMTKVCSVKPGKKTCTPAAAALEKEAALVAEVRVLPEPAVSFSAGSHGDVVKKKAQEAAKETHKLSLGLANVDGGTDSGQGGGKLVLDVDGARRFALPFTFTLNMAGDIAAWARVYCEGSSCVVVAGHVNRTGRGTSSGYTVSAPIKLDAPALDVTAACAGKPRVSLVANKQHVTTHGARIASALEKAGCKVKGPEAAKKERDKTAIYTKDVDGAEAKAFAAALSSTVENLTWDAGAPIVIALGAP